MRRGSMAPAANHDSSHSWARNRDLATVARAIDAKCEIESSHDAARLLANYSDALVFNHESYSLRNCAHVIGKTL